ncbi:MAG: hypothetical protein ACI9WU_000260 [Myxococcota bacterium]
MQVPLEVQQHWLRCLFSDWKTINLASLTGQLEPPQFTLDDSERRLGRWDPNTRTIGISIHHLLTAPWLEVELTLRHEMAHQVVHELLGGLGAQPHGPAFVKACRMLGIGSSPRVPDPGTEEGRRVLARVRKLMNLASSDNPHEAQSAMAAANKLLLKHNLDLQDDDAAAAYSWRWLGQPTRRVTLDRKLIASILQSHFFVQPIWVQTRMPDNRPTSGRMLEVLGLRHNLDLAEYAHDYLIRTLDQLWNTRKRTHGGGNAGRNDFRSGVLMGFQEHLSEQTEVHEEQGLVWLGDPALDDFMSGRYPRTRSMSAGRYRRGDAHAAGKAAGRDLRIRPGVSTTQTNRGRRLK